MAGAKPSVFDFLFAAREKQLSLRGRQDGLPEKRLYVAKNEKFVATIGRTD